MKIKTNVRAGSGSANSGLDSSTSTSSNKQNGGKPVVVVYYPPVSRCVGA